MSFNGMKNFWKRLIISTIKKLTLLSILGIIILGCDRSIPFHKIGYRPDLKIKNFTSTNYQNNMLIWKIKASESSYFYNENRSIVDKINMNYYKDNIVSVKIKAERAIIKTDSKDIEFIGNVNILATSGNRLLTKKIKWNNAKKYIETDEPIKIIRKNGDVITGVGMRANYNLENYEIIKDVVVITKNYEKPPNKKRKKINEKTSI